MERDANKHDTNRSRSRKPHSHNKYRMKSLIDTIIEYYYSK